MPSHKIAAHVEDPEDANRFNSSRCFLDVSFEEPDLPI